MLGGINGDALPISYLLWPTCVGAGFSLAARVALKAATLSAVDIGFANTLPCIALAAFLYRYAASKLSPPSIRRARSTTAGAPPLRASQLLTRHAAFA